MVSKKFLFGAILGTALCLSSCYSDENEVTETTALTTSATAEVTTTAETYETTETTTSYDTGNPEEGLVFFVQPIIEQYDEYNERNLSDWHCRDTDVKREYHYDDEWDYRKELIFAFSNYTDEPVTVDSIQIIRETNSEPVSFTDGSDTLNIDFTVQPLHKTDYLLQAEDFNYSACESGVYVAVVKSNLDYYRMEFFIDNSEVREETFTKVFEGNGGLLGTTGIAPTFLTEEQQEIFAKACARMREFYWYDGYLSEEYADTHTADDFIELFTDVLTEEYARRLAQGTYIDENGDLQAVDSGKGGDIFYCGHCFFPVSADENQVSFKAVVIHAHIDNPYEVWFDEREYHMVNTENGWRVFECEPWD